MHVLHLGNNNVEIDFILERVMFTLLVMNNIMLLCLRQFKAPHYCTDNTAYFNEQKKWICDLLELQFILTQSRWGRISDR